MNYFEVFEMVIEGDLRPHLFDDDGKELGIAMQQIAIAQSDWDDVINYIKKYEKREIVVTDKENNIIKNEKINEHFNDLIDLDIYPPENRKCEIYLDELEFEFIRNKCLIDNFFKGEETKSYNDYCKTKIQHAKKIYDSTKHYQKLILKDQKEDFRDSNYYVVYTVRLFLERLINYIIDCGKPFIEKEFIYDTFNFLYYDMNKTLNDFNITKLLEKKFNDLYDRYKSKTGYNLPWITVIFDLITSEVSNLDNNSKLTKYYEHRAFWKKELLSNPTLDFDHNISKRLIPLIDNEIEHLKILIETDLSSNDKKISLATNNNFALNEKQEDPKVLKRFQHGELKKNCAIVAIKFGFKKGITLTKEQIKKVCETLENEGYAVNHKSVGSTLRDKLGYHKSKYNRPI